MSRSKVDWRSSGKGNYEDFCKKHTTIQLSFDEWRAIIYSFNESFVEYILETGEKAKYPYGFGEFSINKKKRKKIIKDINGVEHINLPIDWIKTRKTGKTIYNFNYHTEGYFFGWMWFKTTSRLKHPDLWYFKPSRVNSRLLSHYLQISDKYQHIYKEWKS